MGKHDKGNGPETLGYPMDFGKYDMSFDNAKQFIFIRHGEKPPKDEMTDDLSKMGEFRANNLDQVFGTGNTPAGYHTPDIIYAMMSKPKSDASNRPFETVKPLAVRIGMEPTKGQRTPETGSGNVFDNRFDVSAHEELKEDVIKHCENGDYKDKTVMFCWEHKNIPYIVAKFGFTKKELMWGLAPKKGGDDPVNKNNFTAIWVFTPSDGGLDFKVYPEFDILNESNSDSPDGPFKLEKPIDGYGVEVYSHTD